RQRQMCIRDWRQPLWVTASCDIMPFDGQEDNIGEAAFFNKKGGAIAFYGTTRTVYQSYNRLMNLAFTRYVLSRDDSGRPMPIGEAVRRTKNELLTTHQDDTPNKLQYTLLGDPALRLAVPTHGIQVDSVNSTPLDNGTMLTLKAGTKATVTGRVLGADGMTASAFNGILTAVLRDIREQITCRLNDTSKDGAEEPFVYYDRPNVVYSGRDSVRNGRFSLTFAVPKDIQYSDLDVQLNLYAVNTDKTIEANGICNQLAMNGTAEHGQGTAGPNIYCYLNSTAFTNGGSVNTTPYFVAEVNDEDGINVSSSGIGHDLQLIIDGDMSKTYSLNDYFQFDFGSYTKGRVGYSIPELSYGKHKLQFRAWDILNNSSTSELTFEVVKGLEPLFLDVECTPNPARTHTTFRIVHDRINAEMSVRLDVFDTSGRHLWSHTENGVSSDNTYTINWGLTVDGGRRLHTGLYLYRLSIGVDGSTYASKTNKLIIFTHQ
ncbi:MAG: type IX secretion system sortase PorU, partial [Prevotella sp.]|nr:type IX secretion system sortase PorU [Prevotella sp.]